MLYEKNGDVVGISKDFQYIAEIYLKFPNRFECYKTQRYSSDKPINKNTSSIFNEKIKSKSNKILDSGFCSRIISYFK